MRELSYQTSSILCFLIISHFLNLAYSIVLRDLFASIWYFFGALLKTFIVIQAEKLHFSFFYVDQHVQV